jgi:hypothetical protein
VSVPRAGREGDMDVVKATQRIHLWWWIVEQTRVGARDGGSHGINKKFSSVQLPALCQGMSWQLWKHTMV